MSNTKIQSIKARQIIDSRGNPTIEADITLTSGHCGRAAVPSGASTGKKEALELRDQNQQQFLGKSVQTAIANIHDKITPVLLGKDASDQALIDQTMIELDATDNKSNLGANATLAVSMAAIRATAAAQGKHLFEMFGDTYKLPTPMMNVINGGAHADNNLDIQEFMIIPHGFATFSASLQAGCEIFQHLKNTLHNHRLSTNVGDEGGFAPALENNDQAIELLLTAIQKAGYTPGEQVAIALDVAASEFHKGDRYISQKGTSLSATTDEMIHLYQDLISRYPIVSIEDPLGEDDWAGWKKLTEKLGDACQWVGDDIFVTNPKILQEGIASKAANAILVKINQIGTISETLETIAMAKTAGYNNVISHRSGETEDTFIADLAVGTAAGQIKTGSLSRSERIAKYNQLLRIEEILGAQAAFQGKI
ncbi:MAG: phosphopyruvate hydratase [Bdellovibrionota bacterium]